MLSYGERLGGGAVCPLCRGVASSEVEIVQRAREGPSSEAEIVPRVRGGCEWAARWASLSPFLSSEWEAGRGPSWAQLPYQVFPFFLKNGLSTPIRVSLIVVPNKNSKT